MEHNIQKSLITIVLIIFIGQQITYSQESLKDSIIELTISGGAWLNSPSKICIGDIGESSNIAYTLAAFRK